uniref:Uncharacterized protein n=1 Tax=Anguilla anguilla TaxID=7936 RepID=A0A0E9W9C9_ANGAN
MSTLSVRELNICETEQFSMKNALLMRNIFCSASIQIFVNLARNLLIHL